MTAFDLAPAPTSEEARERWLEHAAGFILFQDVRGYARARIAPDLSPDARAAAEKGIDDAVYGLMMVIEGVTGILSNETERVDLRVIARHVREDGEGEGTVLNQRNLAETDGVCGDFHGWKDGDFGEVPVATPRAE